jgi:Domain of unknown function (DUF4389)
MIGGSYPVSYDIDPPEQYNRLTVAFRIILAIPQLLLVGGGGYYFFGVNRFISRGGATNFFGYFFNGGVLTAVLVVLVFFAWWAILFTGRFPESFRGFCLMIFRWSQNVSAYMTLQAAPYPPFGEGPYPLRLQVSPVNEHDRLTVAFRVFLGIPHYIALFFLGIAQWIVTVVAWFAILFTSRYPAELFRFSVGVSRWGARVSAYMLLFVDEYPPFSLDAQPGTGFVQSEPI